MLERLKQFTVFSAATSQHRVDLVKGYKTKARIHAVEWASMVTNMTSDSYYKGVLSGMDYETYIDTPGSADIPQDDYSISTHIFGLHFDTAGQTIGDMVRVDHVLWKKWDVVCPMMYALVVSTGSPSVFMKVYYEILPATEDEIVALANQQALQMEV